MAKHLADKSTWGTVCGHEFLNALPGFLHLAKNLGGFHRVAVCGMDIQRGDFITRPSASHLREASATSRAKFGLAVK